MTAKKISDSSAHHDADSFQPHRYCEPQHDGGEGITVGGPTADHSIVRREDGGADTQGPSGPGESLG